MATLASRDPTSDVIASDLMFSEILLMFALGI